MGASHAAPTRDLAHSLDMCPDWESNRRPFGSQAGTQSTEPHQPGLRSIYLPLPLSIFLGAPKEDTIRLGLLFKSIALMLSKPEQNSSHGKGDLLPH